MKTSAIKYYSRKLQKNIWSDTENLSVIESIVRAALVAVILGLSVIDWYLGTYILFFVAPVLFYLELTAFAFYCPIKAIFNN